MLHRPFSLYTFSLYTSFFYMLISSGKVYSTCSPNTKLGASYLLNVYTLISSEKEYSTCSSNSKLDAPRLLKCYTTRCEKLYINLTLAGETETSEPVTVLVLAVLSRRHLRRGVRHIQKCIALPMMTMMHTLSPSTSPSSESRADVIVGQSGLAAAVSGFNRAFVVMMMMMSG